jgi:hypothetical protein
MAIQRSTTHLEQHDQQLVILACQMDERRGALALQISAALKLDGELVLLRAELESSRRDLRGLVKLQLECRELIAEDSELP